MSKKTLLPAAAAAVFVLAAAHRAPAQTATGSNPQATPGDRGASVASIEGTWLLDTNLSDNPEERMREEGGRGGPGGQGGGGGGYPPGGMGGIGGRGGRGGMGGMGGRGGYGGGRGGMDPEAREKFRRAVRDLMEAPERLTITRQGEKIVVADPEGLTLTLVPNGKKVKEAQPDGTDIQRKTKWNGPNLVVETTGKSVPKVTTTYARALDGQHLSVSTKIDAGYGGRSASITRIYDPAPPQ